MGELKGDKLYVEMPSSQVRRRLKGFGHGVRKIISGGRGQAVVIHTALGRNLDELIALFADAKVSTEPPPPIRPVDDLEP